LLGFAVGDVDGGSPGVRRAAAFPSILALWLDRIIASVTLLPDLLEVP